MKRSEGGKWSFSGSPVTLSLCWVRLYLGRFNLSNEGLVLASELLWFH